jgi:hypothetical protein
MECDGGEETERTRHRRRRTARPRRRRRRARSRARTSSARSPRRRTPRASSSPRPSAPLQYDHASAGETNMKRKGRPPPLSPVWNTGTLWKHPGRLWSAIWLFVALSLKSARTQYEAESTTNRLICSMMSLRGLRSAYTCREQNTHVHLAVVRPCRAFRPKCGPDRAPAVRSVRHRVLSTLSTHPNGICARSRIQSVPTPNVSRLVIRTLFRFWPYCRVWSTRRRREQNGKAHGDVGGRIDLDDRVVLCVHERKLRAERAVLIEPPDVA